MPPVTWELISLIVGALFACIASTAAIIWRVTGALSKSRELIYGHIRQIKEEIDEKIDNLQEDLNDKHHQNQTDQRGFIREIAGLQVLLVNYATVKDLDSVRKDVQDLQIEVGILTRSLEHGKSNTIQRG